MFNEVSTEELFKIVKYVMENSIEDYEKWCIKNKKKIGNYIKNKHIYSTAFIAERRLEEIHRRLYMVSDFINIASALMSYNDEFKEKNK